MKIYQYIYHHLYRLIESMQSMRARETALVYLSVIEYFLMSPFIFAFIYRFFPNNFLLTAILGSILLGFLLLKVNQGYFSRRRVLKSIKNRFRGESKTQKAIGFTIVVALFAASVASFMYMLVSL